MLCCQAGELCLPAATSKLVMFPELRSRNNSVQHCASMLGSVVAPHTHQHNSKAYELADQFYKTCKADENSGKTIWLGIQAKLNSEKWKVGSRNSEYAMYIQ